MLFAGAFAPAANAQFSDVRLYGDVNLDFELVNGRQPDGSNPTVNRISSNSSRFGIRGVEYLGAGNAAVFQIENWVYADTGNNNTPNIAARETYVGLQGEWGTFRAGKFLTPYDDIHPIFGNAPTLTSSILSTAAIWAQGPLQKGQGGFDARLGNSIRYSTPNYSGLNGEIQYSTRDSSGNANGAAGDNGDHPSEMRHAYVADVAGFYNDGPVDFGVAYEHNYNVRTTGRNDDALSIAGAYDLGTVRQNVGVRLGAVYEYLRYDTPTGSLKRNFYGVSATVSVGDGVIYAFWGHSPNGYGSATDGTQIGGLSKGPNSAATQWEISYSYPLSPRTLLYAGYVQLANQANAAYTFNVNDYSTAQGARLNGVVFGIAHFF
ncbi:MAG TPA: porin [Casimicrobiaceae bacterium]|nr:porin [Casimicrobiaceae bacterium]